jgi:hypothetical protein
MPLALARTVKRLTRRAGDVCPACAAWPGEVVLDVVEVIVEPGQLPPPVPDEPGPCLFGPCPGCGRVLRARVNTPGAPHALSKPRQPT